jgi:hypothetical protein
MSLQGSAGGSQVDAMGLLVLWSIANADARGWKTNLEGKVRGLNLN